MCVIIHPTESHQVLAQLLDTLLVIGTQLPDSVAITQRLIEVACKVLQNSFQKYFCFDLMGKYFLFFSFIIL